MSAGDHLSPQQFFHGSTHRIEVGDTVRQGVKPPVYQASSPSNVHLTDSHENARQWGEDAHEMSGSMKGWVYVHRVEPVGTVRQVDHPQDGREFQAPAAKVVERKRYPKR